MMPRYTVEALAGGLATSWEVEARSLPDARMKARQDMSKHCGYTGTIVSVRPGAKKPNPFWDKEQANG